MQFFCIGGSKNQSVSGVFFHFRRCVVQSTLGMAPLNLCFNILYVFLLSLFTRITSALFYTTEEHSWTLDTTALTCFRTLYPRIQRGHWRYFGPPMLTKAASIIPGGEGNNLGRRAGIRKQTEEKGSQPSSNRVFCSLMSNPWRNKMDDLRARISFPTGH